MKNKKARCKTYLQCGPIYVNIYLTEKIYKNPSKSNQHLPASCRVTMMLFFSSISQFFYHIYELSLKLREKATKVVLCGRKIH